MNTELTKAGPWRCGVYTLWDRDQDRTPTLHFWSPSKFPFHDPCGTLGPPVLATRLGQQAAQGCMAWGASTLRKGGPDPGKVQLPRETQTGSGGRDARRDARTALQASWLTQTIGLPCLMNGSEVHRLSPSQPHSDGQASAGSPLTLHEDPKCTGMLVN